MNEGTGAEALDTGTDCYQPSRAESEEGRPRLDILLYSTSWKPRLERPEVDLALGPYGGKDLALGPPSHRSLGL